MLDYLIVAPSTGGTFFLGRITIVLYWFLEILFLSAARFAYRYFRYTRVRRHARTGDAAPTLLIGRAADAEVLLRGIESGAIKHIWPVGVLSPSSSDRGPRRRSRRCARDSIRDSCTSASPTPVEEPNSASESIATRPI